ncbi:protein ripply1 [Psammomys obesus]|uniref:protein ripply1 n=1 Tax=Psammomys obesus TaxID=48139 RepID=UPI002452F0AF|nr:protein ripply1 [Psammomys obesus]
MDPAVPDALATPDALAAAPPLPAPAQAPALEQINEQEASGSERGACLWRPWLPSINDQPRQTAGGVTAAEATKTDSQFHHPVRLFWPKSRSLDYMYSAGEMLLQNFPVQATINLYEDSDSEEGEKDKEDNEDEEVNERGPEKCVRVPEAEPHQATANYPNPPLTCPN